MIKSGEFYQVIDMFEDNRVQGRIPYHGGSLSDKADREHWPGNVYNNGTLNAYFQAFLNGYSAGKCVGRME